MTNHGAARRGRLWLSLGMFGTIAIAWAASDTATDGDPAPESAVLARSSVVVAIPPDGGDTATAGVRPLDPSAAPAEDSGAGHVALKPVAGDTAPPAVESPIARALRLVDECQARYEQVRDYVCTFTKRERIDGRLNAPHVMFMKARTRPRSVYLKFRQPASGREAIFVEGRHNGKVLAHDVGLGRLIAGTLHLDPRGSRAMEDCRHPITEAGIGPLLNTLETRWTAELDLGETRVDFREGQIADNRPCHTIQVTHTRKSPDFMFHQVQVYIDNELGLPIRFEAYDWPETPLSAPTLVEEYRYSDLKLNVGLSDLDFDASNEDYAFGRF